MATIEQLGLYPGDSVLLPLNPGISSEHEIIGIKRPFAILLGENLTFKVGPNDHLRIIHEEAPISVSVHKIASNVIVFELPNEDELELHRFEPLYLGIGNRRQTVEIGLLQKGMIFVSPLIPEYATWAYDPNTHKARPLTDIQSHESMIIYQEAGKIFGDERVVSALPFDFKKFRKIKK